MALLLTVATGAWAQDPDPIDLTPSADGTVWTLSTMPEYDVELEVTYYTDAELDQMAADEVIAKITAIGTVTYTPESKALIDAARTAYDALTAAQQALVTNYSTLTDAETTYATAEETAYTEGVELTKNPDGTWSLAATPAFDVELEVEYYPAATLTTAPTSIGEVYATGSAQALVTGGEADGGSFEYALGTDDQTAPTTGWTATVPDEAAPGTYFVWYKVVGDATHSDCETAPACLTATIKGIPVTIASGEYVTYYSDKALKLEDGSDMKLYTVVSVSGNTVTLSDPYDTMPENTPMLVYNPTANDATVQLLLCDDPGLTLTVYDGFKGTAEDKALNADGNGPWNMAADTKYYGFNGTNFVRIMTAGPVAANRCWIEMSSASPARQLTIAFGEGTGVKEVNEVLGKPSDQGRANDNSLYDLQGRRVANGQLKKGVYIVGGNKVVIK